MLIRIAKKTEEAKLLSLYNKIFSDPIIYNSYIFKNYFVCAKTYVLIKDNEIVSAVFIESITLKNNFSNTLKISFLFGIFTLIEHRNKSYMKNILKDIIIKNTDDDIWLQPADFNYYKSSNFSNYINYKICTNKMAETDSEINGKKIHTPLKALNSHKCLEIYKKYFYSICSANSKYYFQKRNINYYEKLIQCPNRFLMIVMINNSYAIFDEETGYVLEFISNFKEDIKFILNYLNKYWFVLVNQHGLEKYFRTRIVRPTIYSLSNSLVSRSIYFNDFLLIE